MLTVLVENTDGPGGIGPADLQVQAPAEATGPAAAVFDDCAWRTVHLPHDFVVEAEFTPKADAGHGSLPTDVGWYRRTLDIPLLDKGRSLWLDFDGVYRNSTVWLNGKQLGNHKSGYIGFRYDITNDVNYGGKNVLAVRCDARAQEGWWYECGGIYRHVWLNKAAAIHVAPDGVQVLSELKPDGNAEVGVALNLDVSSDYDGPVISGLDSQALRGLVTGTITRIGAAAGSDKPFNIETSSYDYSLAGAERRGIVGCVATIPHPMLWSLESPQMYRLTVNLVLHGKVIDSVTTDFGIRTIKFDAEKGFFLNGKPVKIQGTCNHQDFAGVGIAMPDSLLEWRIRKLKEMGCNACRMSHNPPAKELLDACDRLGMLVMDENRHLGDTYRDHTPRGTGYSDLSDLRDMILRDRNHPSIIMWSMCNEEGLQGSEEGARIFLAMKDVVLRYDKTRPITCAMNGGWGQGISLVEDLQGCNYNPGGYDGFHRDFPKMAMYGSETASAVLTRGEYVNDKVKGYVSAYDVNAPSLRSPRRSPGRRWRRARSWPAASSGPASITRASRLPTAGPASTPISGSWTSAGSPRTPTTTICPGWSDRDVVHLLPHWNWPGKEGQLIDVWCHSNADHVELFLNGASLGTKEMQPFGHLEWKVPYAPGRLEAKGYRGGKLIGTDVVETTGPPAQLRLTTDRTKLTADGECVTMVAVSVLDEKGRVVPYASDEVTFSVRGPAAVAGVGNGDPSSHEPDRASKRHAFHGLALAVVQATNRSGKIALTATAPGLKSAEIGLTSAK